MDNIQATRAQKIKHLFVFNVTSNSFLCCSARLATIIYCILSSLLNILVMIYFLNLILSLNTVDDVAYKITFVLSSIYLTFDILILVGVFKRSFSHSNAGRIGNEILFIISFIMMIIYTVLYFVNGQYNSKELIYDKEGNVAEVRRFFDVTIIIYSFITFIEWTKCFAVFISTKQLGMANEKNSNFVVPLDDVSSSARKCNADVMV